MTRISKQSVHAALEKAAKNITDSAGSDGRISRADMKAKLGELSGTEKKLTDIFFRFMDHRDFKAGAQLTKSDVDRAVAYAKEKMVDKYDLNDNGLSKGEIAKMSLTGKLAVDLAKQLKGAAAGGDGLATVDLGKAIGVAAKDCNYISESDSQPTFVSTPWAADKAIDGKALMDAFKSDLLAKYADYGDEYNTLGKLAFEQQEAGYLADLATWDPSTDDYYKQMADGFGRIKKLFDANLTDVKFFKIGPKEEDGNGLASDHGAYQLYLMGRTHDGNLAGVTFEAVET